MPPSRPPPPPKLQPKARPRPVQPRASDERVSPSAEASGGVYRPSDFEHSVHLDAHGQILAGNGKVEELASLAAYVCRLGSLIGEQLGIGPIVGIEAALENGVYLIHCDPQGDIVAIKPRPHLNMI